MPNHTTNYGLIKPLADEFYDVKDQNENMDKIDFELNRFQDEIREKALEAVTLKRGGNVVEANRKAPYNIESLEGKTEVQLVPPFDSATWYRGHGLNIIVDPNDSRKAELVILTAGGQTGFGSFPVVGGNAYDIHFEFELPEHATLTFEIAEYNQGEILPHKEHTITGTSGVFTFTTEPSTTSLSLHISDQQAYSFLVNKLLIADGGQEPSYVDGIQPVRFPSLKITDIEGSEISRLSIQDYFYEGDRLEARNDRLVKVAKRRELKLTGEERYVQVGFNNPMSGVKRISIQNFVHDYNAIPNSPDITAVKPDSKILVTDTYENVIGRDMVGLGDNHLVLSIANEDSGWGDSYNPSIQEIRAYFMGWRMYDGSSGQPVNGYYNRTDGANKRWAYRDNSGALVNSGTGAMVPNTPAPISSKWKLYRLIYKLAQEEIVPVQSFGELQLDKGTNNVEVTEGMVIGEFAKPYNGTSNKRVAIINSTYNTESISALSQPVQKILGIYKNGIRDDSWIIQTTNAYGKERARTEKYDPSAKYTVDYMIMALDSAPIDSITVKYPLNIGSIMDELVSTSAKNIGDISDINKRISNMLSKGEPIEWHDLVLLNGVEPYTDSEMYKPRYARIGNFLVVVGALKGITTTSDFTVSVLPEGFRPLQNWGYSKPASIKGNNPARVARWQISSATGSFRLEAVSDGVSATTDWYPIDVVMIGE